MPSISNNNYKEAAYFMQQMEEATSKNIQFDAGFLEIFENDLIALREEGLQTLQLRQRLEKVAQKILCNTSDVVVPLMGEEMSLEELGSSYDSGSVKEGLTRLNETYKMVPIKGDGHCMFRAIVAGALYHYQKTNTELPAFFDKVKGRPVEEVMNDEHASNELVKNLREISINNNDNEVARSEATVNYGSLKKYRKRMKSMARAEMGGEPELHAIAAHLGLKIHVLNASAIGQGAEQGADHTFFGEKGEDIALLYRPGHYDLLKKVDK